MIDFHVFGQPTPKGSGRAIVSRSTGQAIVIPDSKKSLRSWEGVIRTAAIDAATNRETGEIREIPPPVGVVLLFRMNRPKTRKYETWHETAPDVDKLARAVLDGLTGALWTDDKVVARLYAQKRYCQAGELPGVRVVAVSLQDTASTDADVIACLTATDTLTF